MRPRPKPVEIEPGARLYSVPIGGSIAEAVRMASMSGFVGATQIEGGCLAFFQTRSQAVKAADGGRVCRFTADERGVPALDALDEPTYRKEREKWTRST